ncbi:Bax inhibitor-1/YccA family protein [Cellulomonas cellasea]|uniref:Putative YccA/Bax inhibitor family protein n=1 Tax=Cellulomonas cellasea TaxID=43670 RepID=A0A7W4UI10_9CELL|nr:Bax inhibitor-1/YccA family protein [Cellulomonas cellasea]MBB2923928.1 putative YccA/Bax inhibitor family protein [Cellulomonas cellasea]
MSNPVFNNSDIFGDPRKRGRQRGGTAVQPGQAAGYGAAGAQTLDAASLDQMYGAPSATTAQTGRLTYDDVIVKTGGLLALLVVVAAATWQLAPGLWIFGMIVGLVLGLVNAFKKNPSPALITAYVVAEGVFLGGISYAFQNATVAGESAQPIVMQAVLATFAVFGTALFLFRSGRVRVTPKFTRFLIIGLVGYLAFSVLNLVLAFVLPNSGMFGPLRGGFVGIAVGLLAVGLASMSLILDFDSIKRGVEQGVPAKFAWSAAFGLIVTLVWLYLELLRIFAILRGD